MGYKHGMCALLSRSIYLADAEATTALAARIAPCLGAGDTLLLEGEIGAGKSHLARGLIQAKMAETGQIEDVPSPTFTLVQVYDIGGTEIWHADLYRLRSADEVIETGLDDAFETALCLVEWPDRLGACAPAQAMRLSLIAEGDGRRLTASGPDRWAQVLEAMDGGS